MDRSIKAHSGGAFIMILAFGRQQLKLSVGICSTVKAELRCLARSLNVTIDFVEMDSQVALKLVLWVYEFFSPFCFSSRQEHPGAGWNIMAIF